MTQNQKSYCRWLVVIAYVAVICFGGLVICTNYGEPPVVEVPNSTSK
jgi:hypothetical protein